MNEDEFEQFVEQFMEDMDWDWDDLYEADVFEELQAVYQVAFSSERPGIPVTVAHERSIEYARTRAGDLLKPDGPLSLTKLAKDDLREIVSEGLRSGDGLKSIINEIRESFGFSKARAYTIGRTETSLAIGKGSLDAAVEDGDTFKMWQSQEGVKVCDECRENVDQDWIAIGEDFSDGSETSPAHPNCECDVMYRSERASDVDPTEGLDDEIDEAVDESGSSKAFAARKDAVSGATQERDESGRFVGDGGGEASEASANNKVVNDLIFDETLDLLKSENMALQIFKEPIEGFSPKNYFEMTGQQDRFAAMAVTDVKGSDGEAHSKISSYEEFQKSATPEALQAYNAECFAYANMTAWGFASDAYEARSGLLQESVDRVFDLKNNSEVYRRAVDVINSPEAKAEKENLLQDTRNGADFDKYVRIVYARTQEDLKENGVVGTVRLYRGMLFDYRDLPQDINDAKSTPLSKQDAAKLNGPYPDRGPAFATRTTEPFVTEQNPLTSWTTDRNVALDWAGKAQNFGAILQADVPVKNIFSTGRTGPGVGVEKEVVVIGEPQKVTAVIYKNPTGDGVE